MTEDVEIRIVRGWDGQLTVPLGRGRTVAQVILSGELLMGSSAEGSVGMAPR